MIPPSYQIRDLTIRPATILAPMAGVTDTFSAASFAASAAAAS